MNPDLQAILDFISQSEHFTAEEKNALVKSAKNADKDLEKTVFKLERAEKVKRTTATLLEETIQELEKKRKAVEEQNRTLKIEEALEKVRSSSLSMHKSTELEDVVSILFEKLRELDINMDSACILTFTEGTKDYIAWAANPDMFSVTSARIPFFDNPISNAINEAREMEQGFLDNTWTFEEKNIHWKYLLEFSDWKAMPDELKKAILEFEGWGFTGPVSKKTATLLVSYSRKLFSEREKGIIKRFGEVFDQAYTRFLDLQKAELQTREAQIETALEKVRSRSLAMHHSDELEQVVGSLFDRLVELGLSFDGALIFIFEKEKRNIRLWIATTHLSAPVLIDLPYDEEIKNNAIIKDLWNAIDKGENIINRSYTGETKNEYFRYVSKYNESKIPESVRKIQIEADSWTAYFAAEKNSIVGFDSWSGHIITGDDFQTLIRFAKVFEQAYTRFLDLQKAEAQARESQIQLALERVRARTMAMQKSHELADAARLLYEEFRTLNINTLLCGYCFYKEEQDKQTVWATLPDGTLIPDFVDFPITGDPVLNKRYEDWKQKKPVHILELQDEENKEHHRFLSSKVAGHTAHEVFAQMTDRIIFYCANFSMGYLFIIATEFLRREDEETLIRMGFMCQKQYITIGKISSMKDLKFWGSNTLRSQLL